MSKQRPVFLDLQQIQFPLTAIGSILHRVSGVFMFIAVGVLLWLFSLSLESAEGFAEAMVFLDGFLAKLMIWVILTALGYHLCGGIRHLLMDKGYFEDTMAQGNASAKVAIIVAAVLSLFAGVWVW